MEKKLIPNSTQTPNALYDYVFPFLSESELRVLLYIVRRTYGFHKPNDKISYTQFEGGLKAISDRKMDYGTGMVRSSVARALKSLAGKNILTVKKTGQDLIYEINLEFDFIAFATSSAKKLVAQRNQYRKETSTSSLKKPELVAQRNTQKKEKESRKKDSLTTNVVKRRKAPNEDVEKAFVLWQQATGYPITSKREANRRAAYNLTRKYGLEGVKRLLSGVVEAQGDRYGPRISDYTELQSNLNRLLAWGRQQLGKEAIDLDGTTTATVRN